MTVLKVEPDGLANVGGKLIQHYSDLVTAIGVTDTAAGSQLKRPMGGDATSKQILAVFATHHKTFFTTTTDGAHKWLAGASLLFPVGADYTSVDQSGQGLVNAPAGTLPAVTGGNGGTTA